MENLAHSHGGRGYAVVNSALHAFAGYLQLLTGQEYNSVYRYTDSTGSMVIRRIRVSDFIAGNVSMGYAVGRYDNKEFVDGILADMAKAANVERLIIEF